MPKRDFRNAADDPFGGEPGGGSWIETDSQIFGDLAAIDAQTERIKKIDIFEIFPDPAQPRRAVPSVIRKDWDGTPHGIAEMFRVWWGAIQDERGAPFDLGAYLAAAETERSQIDNPSPSPGPLETAFMTLIDLAASIRRDGLTNPVTVIPTENRYRLETGERRWMAFHLLAWYEGAQDPEEGQQWRKIAARQVEQINVWRQASENNARANLNAISKSRQWAVLMMDLNGAEHFRPLEAFPHERLYYAQAVNLRPPYGKGEQLLNAMGVSGRAALARYRALLLLPDAIWQAGDDLNMPEESLYDMARLAKLDPKHALEKFQQIVSGRNIVALEPKPDSALPDPADYAPGTKRHFAKLSRAIYKAGRGKHKHNAEALKSLRELRIWLDDQETRIMTWLD